MVWGGSWRLLGRCLVVLGGSWRLLSRSWVALGSCWLDKSISIAICKVLVWQPANGTRGGGGLSWFRPPPHSRGTVLLNSSACRTCSTARTARAARVARGPAGTTWAARVARDSFPNGFARLVAPEGPADIYLYISIYMCVYIYIYMGVPRAIFDMSL